MALPLSIHHPSDFAARDIEHGPLIANPSFSSLKLLVGRFFRNSLIAAWGGLNAGGRDHERIDRLADDGRSYEKR